MRRSTLAIVPVLMLVVSAPAVRGAQGNTPALSNTPAPSNNPAQGNKPAQVNKPAQGEKPTQTPARPPAAAEFPSTPPQPGTPRDFKVPEPKRFTLDNGLEVALVQWGTMPKVRVTLSARTGNAPGTSIL
jgi:pyruvate/2-oxoglutarate dehydrogenase complex dihydrolipoamide acyltransferase (E2) component